MSVVKINALQIPPQAGEEVVKRFGARMDEMSKVAGFEGFELLRPTGDNETRWFVYTRWADEESFQAWRSSGLFAQSHARPGGGHPGAEGGRPGAAGGHPGGEGEPSPVATGSALLEFEVTVTASPAPG
jgi:heme-degrading monooxygenase HmoA